MEFINEDARPRFLFHSLSSSSPPLPKPLKISKLHASTCLSSSATLFITASLLSNNPILFPLLIWISLSLLLAPFAPHHATCGDPRVGRGAPLPPPLAKPSLQYEPRSRPPAKRNPSKPNNTPPPSLPSGTPSSSKLDEKSGGNSRESAAKDANRREEWTAEDFEILKRQILKHPVGAPGRWERVAEAFKGRHGAESVVRAAKCLAERRFAGEDSFALFLKRGKGVEKEADDVNVDCFVSGCDGNVVGWGSGEDIALLNALKAFPKDVGMRWEKVAAAVPGKSKGECMKRVAELKRDFRSSKTS